MAAQPFALLAKETMSDIKEQVVKATRQSKVGCSSTQF